MPQASVFSFYPSHVRFADNLVAFRNETGIDGPPIGDIEVALPGGDDGPDGAKGFRTMVTENPAQNPWPEVVNGRSQPNLVFLSRQKSLTRRVLQLLV